MKFHPQYHFKLIMVLTALAMTTIFAYKAFLFTVSFFRENTIESLQFITIKIQKPFRVVSFKELEERERLEKLAEDLANKAVDEYLLQQAITPTPAIKKAVMDRSAVEPSEFFDTIWNNESTRGKNTNPLALHIYCRNKGMWNEIGYNPQAKFCFKDKQTAIAFVDGWTNRNCANKSNGTCLCYWNTGVKSLKCPYSEGDLANAN